MALPGVEERVSHGAPSWFVKKQFLIFADQHHDNRMALWCAAPAGVQEVLVSQEPDKYFRPPYVGVRGWIGAYLDVPVDWDEIAEMVREARACVSTSKR